MRSWGFLVICGLTLGCGFGYSAKKEELASCIQKIAYIPEERFALIPKPTQDLVEASTRPGLFSAGVVRDKGQYWVWIRTAMGKDNPMREEIFQVQGSSLVPAESHVRMAVSGDGLILGPDRVLERWYDFSLGYRLDVDPNRIKLRDRRFPTQIKDIKIESTDVTQEMRIQQLVLAPLVARMMGFHDDVKIYELTLFRSRSDVYLLECWRDSQGDWYSGYRFDKRMGLDGFFTPDPELSFDGTHLSRGWWNRLSPWAPIVRWRR